MADASPVVFVISEDAALRQSLDGVIRRAGLQPETFASVEDFLSRRSRTTPDQDLELNALRDCYQSLSRRERQVMAGVVSGRLNKQVGGELGISEITVKAHRGRVMRKMGADSLAGLVLMAARLATGRSAQVSQLVNS